MSVNRHSVSEDRLLPCHEDAQLDEALEATCRDRARFTYAFLLPGVQWIASATASFLPALAPSFLQSCRTTPRELHEGTLAQRRSTAYLDGLRGVAAWAVFNYHFAHGTYARAMDRSYHSLPIENNTHFLQLPLMRLVYAAEASVAMFFVLSGYVLSQRSIAAISTGDLEKANARLSSLAFRRGIRLFGPALIASLLAYLTQRAGWMPAKGLPKNYVRNFQSDSRMYMAYLGTLLDVWTWSIDLEAGEWWFNPHLWTIPVEFRCSMVVFVFLMATQRCKTWVRFTAASTLLLQSLWVWRWDFAAFVAGTLVADCENQHLRVLGWSGNAGSPTDQGFSEWMQESSAHHWYTTTRRVAMFSAFVLGLFLASYPYVPPKEDAFFSNIAWTVSYETEGRRVFYTAAGTLILLALVHEPLLQTLLETPLPRYFGRISYSCYLIHGLVIRLIGGRILHVSWKITGTEGSQLHIGFFLGYIVLFPLVIWAADLFERAIDSACVAWSKRMESLCTDGH